MKFKASIPALRAAIKNPLALSEAKGSRESNLLLSGGDTFLVFSGTDGNLLWSSTTAEVQWLDGEHHALCVPADKLSGILIGDGEIGLDFDGKNLRAEIGRSRYTLPWSREDDFSVEPEILTNNFIEVESKWLADAIGFCERAISGKAAETEGLDAMVLYCGNGQLALGATDKVQIAYTESKIEIPEASFQIALNKASLAQIRMLLDFGDDRTRLRWSDKLIGFWQGSTYLISGIIEYTPPDLKRIMAMPRIPVGTLGTQEFQKALHRLKVVDASDEAILICDFSQSDSLSLGIESAIESMTGSEEIAFENALPADHRMRLGPQIFKANLTRQAVAGFKSGTLQLSSLDRAFNLMFSDGFKTFSTCGIDPQRRKA